jgi:hypothetical protein
MIRRRRLWLSIVRWVDDEPRRFVRLRRFTCCESKQQEQSHSKTVKRTMHRFLLSGQGFGWLYCAGKTLHRPVEMNRLPCRTFMWRQDGHTPTRIGLPPPRRTAGKTRGSQNSAPQLLPCRPIVRPRFDENLFRRQNLAEHPMSVHERVTFAIGQAQRGALHIRPFIPF